MTQDELAVWIERSRRARGEPSVAFPVDIVPGGCAAPVPALRAAVTALVGHLVGKPCTVSFRPGSSWADLARGAVNVDGSLLESENLADSVLHALGGAAHEAAHHLYSDPTPVRKSALERLLTNLVDDERIERLLAHEIPTLAHPLAALRRKLLQQPDQDGEVEVLGALFRLVRVPQRLTPDILERHGALLDEALRVLEPFPATPDQVHRAGRRLAVLARARGARAVQAPVELIGCGCARGHSRDPALHAARHRFHFFPDLEAEPGVTPRLRWREAALDPAGYAKLRALVAREASELATALRALRPLERAGGRRHGRLDRRALWRTPLDGRLWTVPDRPRGRLAIALLLDLSGSFAGLPGERAQRFSVALSEAAQAIPGAQLYVYGHRADVDGSGSTDVLRFATPARGPVTALGRYQTAGNNRDAHAIESIGRDLLRQEANRTGLRLAFVVSDASPNAAGFRGAPALAATRRALHWLGRAWSPPILVAPDEWKDRAQVGPRRVLRLDQPDALRRLVALLPRA